MKRFATLCAALTTCFVVAPHALAQIELQQPQLVAPAAHDDSATHKKAEASPSDKAAPYVPALTLTSCDSDGGDAACGCEKEASCNCEEPSCGCDSCSSCCGGGCCLFGDCCLGDPCTLKDQLTPCCDVNYGGWIQMGYHSDNTGLSRDRGDLLDTNDVPDNLNLQQAWLYVEKIAKGDACCAGWGYRADVVYGTDGQLTQAFGNSGAPFAPGRGNYDNSLDHGVYGWAIPQAYAQVAYGDWSWKIGHWYTPMGYEVFPATGNFFYSHSLEFFNSEPFTHTGVIGTFTGCKDVTYTVGWALGWDTGFDEYGSGNIFIGGISRNLNDCVTLSYMTCLGDLGFRSADEFGYTHTLMLTAKMSDKTTYVLQSDLVSEDGLFGDDTRDNQDYGVAQYLFYEVNDCWKLGARVEWWNSDQVTGDQSSFYELTGGINYKPHANLVIRPEIRYDWSPSDEAADLENREIFGIDAIFTF